MANILRRDIAEGETVLDEDGKKWVVSGGFGLRAASRGWAVFAKCEDGREGRIENIIDRKATEAYNEEQAKTLQSS